MEHILGTAIHPEGGIIEIQNKLLKYQWVEEDEGGTLYLSQSYVLLDFYEKTIEHVAEGIQIYDKNGYFLHANSVSESIENFKNKDFKGKHLLDLYDLREEFSTVLTVLRTQEPVINRCDRFKTASGKTLTTINSAYPIKIDGTLCGAVVFESDYSILNYMKNRAFNLEAYIENQQLDHQYPLYTFDDIIHVSQNMKDIIHFAKKVSLTDSSILIVGATGTGKELIAQSIHSFSPRRHKPFIDVNCSAVPSNLFESLFFGTEKGAFTGSMRKQGFFEMADKGTLFLDEINSLSKDMQVKLLRALQEKRFQRIGGSKYIHSDVRIIAAANEDVFDLMEQEKLRKDFYYRISTIKINIPPLMERREDIPALAEYFLNKICLKYNRRQMTISEEVFDALIQYDWPGNVRELQHVVEYALNRSPDNATEIKFESLPEYMKSSKSVTHRSYYWSRLKPRTKTSTKTFKEWMKQFEKELLYETLLKNHGNITQSAKELGLKRQSLQYRIRKLGIHIK